MDVIGQLQQLLQLGWPGIVLLMIYILWKSYEKRTQETIDILRAELDRCQDRDDNERNRTKQNM